MAVSGLQLIALLVVSCSGFAAGVINECLTSTNSCNSSLNLPEVLLACLKQHPRDTLMRRWIQPRALSRNEESTALAIGYNQDEGRIAPDDGILQGACRFQGANLQVATENTNFTCTQAACDLPMWRLPNPPPGGLRDYLLITSQLTGCTLVWQRINDESNSYIEVAHLRPANCGRGGGDGVALQTNIEAYWPPCRDNTTTGGVFGPRDYRTFGATDIANAYGVWWATDKSWRLFAQYGKAARAVITELTLKAPCARPEADQNKEQPATQLGAQECSPTT